MITAFAIGWIIGFAVAIPPGPLSLTVFTYAIERGSRAAALIALGGMVCEVAYAFLGFMGIRFAEDAGLGVTLRIISCVTIFVLGMKYTFGELRLDVHPAESKIHGQHSLLLLGLVLTGTAPTIAAAYLVLAGAAHSLNYFQFSFVNNLFAAFAAGVGSMSWILCTIFFIRQMRKNLTLSIIRPIARGSGILLLAVGAYSIAGLIHHIIGR